MSYANPRKLKREKQSELLDQARVHGMACLKWIEEGMEERAREQATLAARAFFKADRLKKVRIK